VIFHDAQREQDNFLEHASFEQSATIGSLFCASPEGNTGIIEVLFRIEKSVGA
jgi:hypothetical protein